MEETEALKIVCELAEEALHIRIFDNEEYGDYLDKFRTAIELVEKMIAEKENNNGT